MLLKNLYDPLLFDYQNTINIVFGIPIESKLVSFSASKANPAIFNRSIGRGDRASATETVGWSSIPSRVKSNTQKKIDSFKFYSYA